MKAPKSPAARRTMALWSAAPRSSRLHTTIRWWSAPFTELELEVPLAGDVLEVGCGHGIFTVFLGISSRARRVVGIDIDSDKIALAKSAASGLRPGEAEVDFDVMPAGSIPALEGGWRAIVFADVLYLMHPEDRAAILSACFEALAPGGLLIVKEVDTRPRMKALLAQFQEILSTRVFRITRGSHLDFPSLTELESLMTELGMSTIAKHIDHGYIHPHCVVIGTKPAS
ncbi:UbiG 2-polyprenyl-3-methyl-5-hydroxy-6-metoxy-1,4-benzoquinol methylase [Acidimicrobiia bacterium]